MRYFFRQVEGSDRQFLYRLKRACLKEYVTAIWGWDEADQWRRFVADFDPAVRRIVVAFGRDVGQYAVQIETTEIFLRGLYLLPAYQRRGLGGRILQDLLSEARQGRRPVRLQVLVGNPARNLYRRLGFAIVDKTDTHLIMRNDH